MELLKLSDRSQWRDIKKLYKTAFPKYEQKPFFLIRHKHSKGMADVWVISQDGEFRGFAITMNSDELILLDYFAVSADKRGGGIGTQALKALQQQYSGKRLFLEIESVYTDADNLPERQRRKSFYLANGMTELKVMANLFGTEMELLGFNCCVSFEEYHALYTLNYGSWAKRNVKPLPYPEDQRL